MFTMYIDITINGSEVDLGQGQLKYSIRMTVKGYDVVNICSEQQGNLFGPFRILRVTPN